jgi:hypothetical protein
MKIFLAVTAFVLFASPSFAKADAPQVSCTAYFGVLQYDPQVPGSFVAAMSSSQAKWFAKNGPKHYAGLCLSLEKAKYLIVWTTSTQVATSERTVQRTGTVDTSTIGSERGTFDTYGALSTWGNYSGSFSSNSTSTYTYSEVVPVTTATDHCYIYVLKSVGATVWEDVRNKTSQPQAIFSAETFRPRPVPGQPDPSGATQIGFLLRKEPTAHALDEALKSIFEHGAQTTPIAALLPHQEESGDASTSQPAQTPVTTATDTTANNTKIHITSTPDGGEVYVDGKFRGNAPSDILLARGEHVLKVVLHQKEWNRTIEVTGGEINVQADLGDGARKGSSATDTDGMKGGSTWGASQPAVDSLREMARKIRECRTRSLVDEHKWGKKATDTEKIWMGPPSNVAWDVTHSESARSPYSGYLQFMWPADIEVPAESYAEWSKQEGVMEEQKRKMFSLEWRYEFDVGPSGLELLRVLTRNEGESKWEIERILDPPACPQQPADK